MEQLNPVLQNGASIVKTRRTSRFSKMIGGAIALVSMMFAFDADATHIPVTTFNAVNAGVISATSSCVSGYFTNNWQTPGTGYWDYTVNTVGFTGITMTFKNQKSAAAGPTLGSIYYNIGGSDVLISSFVPSTSCPSGFTVVNLPAACEGVSNLHIKVKMTGATANTATHRITSDPFDGTTSSCVGTPTAGSITAGANPICAGTATTLTLGGASAGGGISYQWQSSATGAGGSFTNITGATNLTYNVPTTQTSSIYYQVVVTCPASGFSATTAALHETINSVSFSGITGVPASPLVVGSTASLVNVTPAGGVWQSSVPAIASIDAATGVATGIKGGTTNVSYTVVDGTTGCVGSTSVDLNVVWPNTLALYAGANGNSTNVITVPNETTSGVVATGFGTASPCTSGGISGLTMPTSITSFGAANPHVGYKIYPASGHALNVFRIHATTRESGTGPAKAIIAYRRGATATWTTETVAVNQNTGGSCGAASTSWDFAPSLTEMGITDSLEVAVFPFSASSGTGTFQLNSLEVYGIVSDDVNCSGLSHPGALEAPTKWIICDSGSRWLNYNGQGAGVGVTLTWQKAVGTAGSFTDISPVVNTASYNTGMLYATNPADTFTRYRVRVHCVSSSADAFSAPDTIIVHGKPSAGAITGIPTPFLHVGDVVTLTAPAATGSLTFWRSNFISSAPIDSATGDLTGIMPGFAYITVVTTNDGVCFGSSRDSVSTILPLTVAAYIGKGGNSTTVNTSTDAISGSIAKVGAFGSTGSCGFGGLSGMTTTVTAYNTANPHVSLSFQANNNFTVDGFNVTLRRSNNGPQYARLAYRVNGGTWSDDGFDQPVDMDDCGYSQNILSYAAVLPALTTGDNVEFAIFPINDAAQTTGGSFQVNTFDITSSDASSVLRPASVANAVKAETIKLYPNPATNVLNVVAAEKVNVTILSIDGKKLIDQKNATSINISALASGMYLIQVSDVNNHLIETAKFTKQ